MKECLGDEMKRKRAKPMKGEWEDDGVYYRCVNCGFICKLGRDGVGEAGNVESSINYEEVVIEGITYYKPVVTNGCPFCGCLNWLG